jgi:hypothetical protein
MSDLVSCGPPKDMITSPKIAHLQLQPITHNLALTCR